MTASKLTKLFALLAIVSLSACGDLRGPEFAFPEGSVEAGQEVFVSYGCTQCHTIPNADLPPPDEEGPVRVILGGKVSKARTYSELVTSIVNPSHRISARYLRKEDVSRDGESLMISYNDVMTVSELIDLVAFLESRYEEIERPQISYTRLGGE